MTNLRTKFEVPNFAHYLNTKGVVKCKERGGLGWLGVIQVTDFVTNGKPIYDFLLMSSSNYGPILHRFGDTTMLYYVENHQICLPLLDLTANDTGVILV